MKKKLKTIILVLSIVLGVTTQGYSINTKPEVKKTTNDNIPEKVSLWLEKELANTSTQVLKNFDSSSFYTSKSAKIIGYIKGYDQVQGAKTGIFYYRNDITRENKPRVLEIHKDGRFELELPLEYPMLNHFIMENKWIQFYLEPGQNLSIILNWDDLKARRTSSVLRRVAYQGNLAKINTDLINYKSGFSQREIQKEIQKGKKTMEAIAFKDKMFLFREDFLEKTTAYLTNGEIGNKTAELLKDEIELTAFKYMFDYFSFSKLRKLKKEGINTEDIIPENYYDFIKELPLNRQSILISSEFGVFVNRLEFSKLLGTKRMGWRIAQDDFYLKLLKFIESKNVELTNEELELLKNGYKMLNENEKSAEKRKELSAFVERYQKIYIEFFTTFKMDSQRNQEEEFKREEKEFWEKRDSLANTLGIQNKLVYEIIKSRKLEFNMLRRDNSDELKKWWWSFMKENITSPHLQKLGDEFLKKSLNQAKVYELPDTEKGTAIFKKLISPYKGTVVMVQYWSPRSYYKGEDLERLKKKRNLFKGNSQVVFLDVSNERGSSLETYHKNVEENGFENSIRITEDDCNYLRQLFKFNSSVKNIVVNPEGEIVRGYRDSHMLEYFLKENFNILPASN